MKRYLLLITCAVVLLGIGSSLLVTQAVAEPLAAVSDAGLPTLSRQGGGDAAALFDKLCAACHGDKGEGGYGPALTYLKDGDAAALADVITHGKGKMPPAGAGLTSAEVEALVGFIKDGFVVSSPAGSKPVQLAPTVAPVRPAHLSVDLRPQTDGRVEARVAVRSGEGVPIPGAAVDLYRLTTMGGKLPVGKLVTGASGEAALTLTAVEGQVLKVEAGYAGSDWGPGQAQASIEVQGTGAAPSLVSPLTSRSTPPALVATFALVFGGVWLTYGLVAYRLLQIARQTRGT